VDLSLQTINAPKLVLETGHHRARKRLFELSHTRADLSEASHTACPEAGSEFIK
jgi:hypothetical protein